MPEVRGSRQGRKKRLRKHGVHSFLAKGKRKGEQARMVEKKLVNKVYQQRRKEAEKDRRKGRGDVWRPWLARKGNRKKSIQNNGRK